MKVMLINSPYPVAWMYGLKKALPSLVHKQLGIGYIAAGLEAKGHRVAFIDGQALALDTERVLDLIRRESPDLIGAPCFALGRKPLYDLVKRIRSVFPDMPVVIGGPHATYFPERLFEECPEISLLLRGEADFTMGELATRIEQKLSIADIPGIIVRDKEGQLVYGPPPEIIHDLDRIPFPARHVYEDRLYNPMPVILSLPQMRTDQVITARSCDWGKCRFCFQSVSSETCYRRRSPENVIAELRQLVDDKRIEFIIFFDDNFLRDEQWVFRFCDLYDQERFRFRWCAMGRVNTVTPAILRRAAGAGCVRVSYGIESANQETLNLIRKGTTLEQARDAVRWSHEAGLQVRAFVIFGLPRETPQMAWNSLRFVIDLDVDYVVFYPYFPMEGTPLAEIALMEGKHIPHDNMNFLMPSYVPDTYDNPDKLKAMIRTAYRRFYLRPGYLLRALWTVRHPRLWPSLMNKTWMALQVNFLMNK